MDHGFKQAESGMLSQIHDALSARRCVPAAIGTLAAESSQIRVVAYVPQAAHAKMPSSICQSLLLGTKDLLCQIEDSPEAQESVGLGNGESFPERASVLEGS